MKPLQVYLSEDIIKKLKLAAIEQGTSMSDLVREKLGANVEVVRTQNVPINQSKKVIHKVKAEKADVWKVPGVVPASEAVCKGTHYMDRTDCGKLQCPWRNS